MKRADAQQQHKMLSFPLRRSARALCFLLPFSLLVFGPAPEPAAHATGNASPATFRNPLKKSGADPWLTYYDGYYWLSATTASDIRLRRARHIGDLANAPDEVIWKDDNPRRFRDLWAPEFHRLTGSDGKPHWYLYYTASDGQEPHHRMFVAESAGDDLRGPYTFKAQLQTDPEDAFYAIDGTVLKTPKGDLYFVWCGRPSSTGQGLYIARMTNPWTIMGPRTYLNADGFGCRYVREGPITLQKNNKVFLVYSACGADTPDYKLGMLIADAQANLLEEAAWKQHPKPVFGRVDQWGVFGPGHNSFFKSPDGKEDWITYHAKTTTNVTFGDRSARAQKFTWSRDGLPDFGLPASLDTDLPVPSGEPRR